MLNELKIGDTFVSTDDAWDQQRQFRTLMTGQSPYVVNGIGHFAQAGDLSGQVLFSLPRYGTKQRAQYDVIEDIASKRLGDNPSGITTKELISATAERTKADPPFVEGCLRLLVAKGNLIAKKRRSDYFLQLSQEALKNERKRSFATSFAHELVDQAVRIGDLIAHGPTVGTYREELLRELIQRHIPQRFHAATGFIVGADKQLDILIYDRIDHAPVFHAGNLVVVQPEAVRAVIEVKSTLTPVRLREALRDLNIFKLMVPAMPPVFTGVFAFKQTGTTAALLRVLKEFYRFDMSEDADLEEKGMPVTAYDIIDAACVLRKSLIAIEYFPIAAEDGSKILSPAAIELESSSQREFQAAWFFGRLSQYLRFPFNGEKTSRDLLYGLPGRTWAKTAELINERKLWGCYDPMNIEIAADHDMDSVAIFKEELRCFNTWLSGGSWDYRKPVFDPSDDA